MVSDDLTKIERRLQERAIDLPPALRSNVLAAVGRELARPSSARPAGSIWTYLAAAAAIAIVALNLARMSAMLTDFVAPPESDPRQMRALAASIQKALPDLPPGEAQRMALELSAGQRLIPLPLVQGKRG